ncbi:MAG: TolC family protein, partial [Gammaproteobacteria bacterium]
MTGDQLAIGIADVRSQAITNNLEVQTELVRPALLREDRREAEARFLPTAFARYAYSSFDEPGVPPTRNANGSTIDDAELGIVVPLQTGGSARVSVPITRTDFGVPGIENVQDAATTFSLSQPLLRDAGRHVNLAPITVARLRERQQDAQTKLAILNVLAGADRFYWNLYAAARAVEVRLAQYERAKEQERQATRLAAEGVVPAIEVVRARAGVARRVEDIIRAENTRRQVEREIKRAMNRRDLPVTGSTSLMVTTPPAPIRIMIDRAAALDAATANRMELLSLELQLAVDALTVDITRNQKLPSLALDYSFRYLGASNELAEAFEQIGRTDFANQSIGLTLEVPLGNQAREARYNRAVLQRALTAATRAQQYQIIERQVLDTIDQLDEAWQRILAAREETLLAARNFQAEQRQFRAGVRTSTDVLIAADFL